MGNFMKDSSVYRDIAARTNGDIYIGVVGPVRTGKSTFIKKFMETLVIPNIENDYRRGRAIDELPQSAAGGGKHLRCGKHGGDQHKNNKREAQNITSNSHIMMAALLL